MKFSAYQNKIFAFLAETVHNLIVRAGAGSGKTTLLAELILIPSPLKGRS